MTKHVDIASLPLDPFVDGKRISMTQSDVIPTFDPAAATALCDIPISKAELVDEAVQSAKRALKGPWGRMTPAERSRALFRVAQLIRRDAERLAIVESLDSGKPLREAKGDIETSARYFEYYAGIADKLQGDTIPLGPDFVSFTLHEPVGVTAHIIPWNFPLVTTARGLAPALATGCTAIVKPAEQTPLTALILADHLTEAGIPAGVVNIVCGPGEVTGARLVQHPDVAHITFTGSVETGKIVMRSAADHVASVTLELGGKSPLVVLDDANMEEALAGTLKAAFMNAGQVCSAGSRVIIERGCADAFLSKLSERVGSFSVGRGLDDPDLGPIVSSEQLQKISTLVGESLKGGAKSLAGGNIRKPAGLGGWFFEPTILLAEKPSNLAVQDEFFGPVLTVQVANDFDHACQLADGTDFGLVAGIYTKDISKALKFSRFVSSGQVFINQYFAGGVETPFGGTKNSGFGREKGLEGLKAYYSVKTITARL
jgi:acyl-CoA reductase-like NAD-dependent aldehyde dehydrogenase